MTKVKTLVNGNIYDVEVLERNRNLATFVIAGRSYTVELAETVSPPTSANENTQPGAKKKKKNTTGKKQSSSSGSTEISAPIPGLLVGIDVEVGESVTEGQVLLRLEAMKMENSIVSPKDATITSIEVELGDEVKDGQVLIRLD